MKEEEKNLQDELNKNTSLAEENSSFFDENDPAFDFLGKKDESISDENSNVNILENSRNEDENKIENEDVEEPISEKKDEQILEPQNNQKMLDSISAEINNDDKKDKKKKDKKRVIESFDLKEKFEAHVVEAEEIAAENREEIAPTVEKTIVVAEKEVRKKNSKFMRYFYIACLVVNIISFIVFLIINSQSKVPFAELAKSANVWWLFVAFGCFIATMLVESLRYYILILRGSKKSRPIVSFNTAAIGKYFDFITPLSTGGQAMQISYLTRKKIDGSFAASVPVTKYIYNQFCYLLVIITLFLLSGQPEFGDFGAKFIGVAAYIGLTFQCFLLFVVFFFSISKKIAPACTIGVLKFLRKIHIIKDYKEIYVKVLKFVHDYQVSFKKFFTDFFSFFVMFFSSLLLIVIRCAVPFFIYSSFFGFEASLIIPICARTLMCELAMGIWILPGNVIFADVAFMALFKSVFIGGTLFWALLFWRIISYYLYIIQGFIAVPIINHNNPRYIKPKPPQREQPFSKTN